MPSGKVPSVTTKKMCAESEDTFSRFPVLGMNLRCMNGYFFPFNISGKDLNKVKCSLFDTHIKLKTPQSTVGCIWHNY